MGKGPLALLILVMSMFGPLSTDMYLSGLPQMVDDFGTNEATMNMSLYMFMLVLSFSILFLGPISDKYGRRNVLAATMSVYIVSNLACMFVTNVWVFIILRMIQAFGGAGAMVSGFALIKDCFKGPERGRILSIVAVLGILGPILSPVIGTALINTMGWHSTFLAPALIALLCLAMGMLLPKELPVERLTGSITQTVRRIAVVLKDRGFTMFLVMMTIFVASQLAYISVSSYIYQDKFGFSTTEYSIALAAVCIISLGDSQAILRMHLCNLSDQHGDDGPPGGTQLGALHGLHDPLLREHHHLPFVRFRDPHEPPSRRQRIRVVGAQLRGVHLRLLRDGHRILLPQRPLHLRHRGGAGTIVPGVPGDVDQAEAGRLSREEPDRRIGLRKE